MNPENTLSYRAGLFDGPPSLAWLRPGWRGLRLYGRKAKAAILAGDTPLKADMILRADALLNIMSGILGTQPNARLGPALMTIYAALRYNLLRANLENSISALDDFEAALAILDRDLSNLSESAIAA
jgi:flagellin-specific chaperone FliS